MDYTALVLEILAIIGAVMAVLGLGVKWNKAKSDFEELMRQMKLLVSAWEQLAALEKKANEDGKVTSDEFAELMDEAHELMALTLEAFKQGNLVVEDVKDLYNGIMELVKAQKGGE
jgi:hypothetical protein